MGPHKRHITIALVSGKEHSWAKFSAVPHYHTHCKFICVVNSISLSINIYFTLLLIKFHHEENISYFACL